MDLKLVYYLYMKYGYENYGCLMKHSVWLLYSVQNILYSLNDVANDAESTQKSNNIIIANLKSVEQWVN